MYHGRARRWRFRQRSAWAAAGGRRHAERPRKDWLRHDSRSEETGELSTRDAFGAWCRDASMGQRAALGAGLGALAQSGMQAPIRMVQKARRWLATQPDQ